jgi:hypothetical protein
VSKKKKVSAKRYTVGYGRPPLPKRTVFNNYPMVDPTVNARSLWLRSHPLPAAPMATEVAGPSAVAAAGADLRSGELGQSIQSIGQRGANNETNPIIPSGPQ